MHLRAEPRTVQDFFSRTDFDHPKIKGLIPRPYTSKGAKSFGVYRILWGRKDTGSCFVRLFKNQEETNALFFQASQEELDLKVNQLENLLSSLEFDSADNLCHTVLSPSEPTEPVPQFSLDKILKEVANMDLKDFRAKYSFDETTGRLVKREEVEEETIQEEELAGEEPEETQEELDPDTNEIAKEFSFAEFDLGEKSAYWNKERKTMDFINLAKAIGVPTIKITGFHLSWLRDRDIRNLVSGKVSWDKTPVPQRVTYAKSKGLQGTIGSKLEKDLTPDERRILGLKFSMSMGDLSSWASAKAAPTQAKPLPPRPATTTPVQPKPEPAKPVEQPKVEVKIEQPRNPTEAKKLVPAPTPVPESVRLAKIDPVDLFDSSYKALGESFKKVAQYALDLEDDNITMGNLLDQANKENQDLKAQLVELQGQLNALKPFMEAFKAFQSVKPS